MLERLGYRTPIVIALSASIVTFASQVLAQDNSKAPTLASAQRTVRSLPAEVSIPNTRQFDFVSKVNGRRYSISVALPFEPPPSNGYGVLYVLDGNVYFASAAEAVRNPDKAPGVVVVGIGYPDDPTYARSVVAKPIPLPAIFDRLPPFRVVPYLERLHDLFLPATEPELEDMNGAVDISPRSPAKKYRMENFGGMDDFLKTIEAEVKPRVAALVPIDSGNQAIFGHSAGGSTVLHALFVEPDAFRTFIIASPAIFWDNKVVLADRDKFATAVNTGRAAPRILVTMGSEESGPELPARWAMVENGRDLVAWLKTLHGSSGYLVEDYAVFDKTSHVYSPWPALARGVAFAFAGGRPFKPDVDEAAHATSR